MIDGMRISQYVYFALKSERVSAHEMTSQLGLEPDEIMVRGSKGANPLRPVVHAWEVVCREPGLTVDEQIGRILDRLEPYADRIAALVETIDVAEPGVTATLQVVRSFNDDEGEEDLLGWHLDKRTLRFLHRVGAELDVDEYA
jgi:hypothetical protein